MCVCACVRARVCVLLIYMAHLRRSKENLFFSINLLETKNGFVGKLRSSSK